MAVQKPGPRRPQTHGTARPRSAPGERRREATSPDLPAHFRAVIHWALATAKRREKIANFRWEHIHVKGHTAHLPKTKNEDARSVPPSRRALAIFRVIPKYENGSTFGISPNAVRLAMRRATAEVGIEGVTFHDIRREAVSRLFEYTHLDSLQISRITGHRTMQMLSRYTRLRAGDLARDLDRQRR